RHSRRGAHLRRRWPSADVRPLRPYRSLRSPKKAPSRYGALDHPRCYPRRCSRAYDEVRVPYPVGVLEHPCQTNSSNSSPNRSAPWTKVSPNSPPTPQSHLAKNLRRFFSRLHLVFTITIPTPTRSTLDRC